VRLRAGDVPRTPEGLLARCLNHVRGESGTFFDRNNVDIKKLKDGGAIFTALAYTSANPVAAGGVERGADWRGVHSVPKDMGRPGREVRRPEWLFRNRFGEYVGELPKMAILTYELPPVFRPEDRGQVIKVNQGLTSV
jgi:hypothetical protein